MQDKNTKHMKDYVMDNKCYQICMGQHTYIRRHLKLRYLVLARQVNNLRQ